MPVSRKRVLPLIGYNSNFSGEIANLFGDFWPKITKFELKSKTLQLNLVNLKTRDFQYMTTHKCVFFSRVASSVEENAS